MRWRYQCVTKVIMGLVIQHRYWIVPVHDQWCGSHVQLSENALSTADLARWCAATWVLQVRWDCYQEESEPGNKDLLGTAHENPWGYLDFLPHGLDYFWYRAFPSFQEDLGKRGNTITTNICMYNLCVYKQFFFTFTAIHKIFKVLMEKILKTPYKNLFGKQVWLALAINVWGFIENYFLTRQFSAIIGKLKLCEINFCWKFKLFWVKWTLSFQNMFCKNWKLALKICFKATEIFQFIFSVFVAKLLDAIWRSPGIGRQMWEEKEKRQKNISESRLKASSEKSCWFFFFSSLHGVFE